MSPYKVVNVFSADDKGGNPCAVVDNADHLSKEEMQALATQLNLPETVFILQNNRKFLLRFFATKGELPLCYHGTLGAAFHLQKIYGFKRVNLTSYTDCISMDVKCEENLVSLSVPNNIKVIPTNVNIEIAQELLKVDEYYVNKDLPCFISSVGNPKLFIPILDRTILFHIEPDLNLISQWCKEHKVNGIYAYSSDTEHSDSDYVGRNFNPLFSHKEDIATGTAVAALCQMLFLRYGPIKNTFTIEQGTNLNNPSKIAVLVTEDALEIKGEAYFSKINSEGNKNVFQ